MSVVAERELEVVIAGAGPTGLMLAAELALGGAKTVVIEREPVRPGFCRGFNLNARSLELLDRRGVAERFLAEGPKVPFTSFAGLEGGLDLALLETDHPYTLGIPQTRTEELLEEWVGELGVPVRRGEEVIGLEQCEDHVTTRIRTADGEATLRSAFLVGCDGGRSAVRKLTGVSFPGTPATEFALLGDVELADPETLGFGAHRTPRGAVFVIPRPGYVRVITRDPRPPAHRDTPVTLSQLQGVIEDVLGRAVELKSARWLTRFGNAARQAEQYRAGRVLLAGDAAHVHPPAGAQGLNVGLQDVVNLGWKLAAAVRGWAPSGLLDTYHDERHPAGAAVLAHTQAQSVLGAPDERSRPVCALFAELSRLPEVRRYLAGLVTGISTRYPLPGGEDHPLLGRLAPNLCLQTAAGGTCVAKLLHPARGVLLDLTPRGEFRREAKAWSDRIDGMAASCPDHPELAALLIRPDGYVAWSAPAGGEPQPARLRDALERWFGPARGGEE
jgi:2-polyprenyl-6-methoxyphenol hydroxylase-like FAD-dependent oxidoreductase